MEAARDATDPVLRPLGAGFDPDNPEGSCLEVIDAYYGLDARARRLVERCFVRMGLGEVASALRSTNDEPPQAEPYTCGILGTVVVSPCRHGTCRFHLPGSEEHHNCLMVASNQNEMSVDAIAAILDIPESDVQDEHLAALREMRRGAVEIAKEHAELSAEFVMLPTLRVCAVCENAIKGKPFMVERGVAFCSVDCSGARNTAHVLIEARTGIPADKIIRWVDRHFDTVEAAAQSLDFPTSVLTEALGR